MSDSDDNPGVIAPPPLLFTVAFGAGITLDFMLPRFQMGVPGALRYGLSILLAVTALALLAGALGRFRRADTPAKPWRPTARVVTDGVYGFTRNPMYLAMALGYIAVAIAADSVGALLFLAPLLLVLNFGVIAREERYLEAKFNDEYRRYKRSVRRWL